MSDFVQLQNITSEVVKAYAEGETFLFQPRAVKIVTKEEAEELLSDWGHALAVVDKNNRSQDRVIKSPVQEVWVANFTGNPDAPATVSGWSIDAAGRFVYGTPEPYAAKEPRDVIAINIGRKEVLYEDPMSFGKFKSMRVIPGREERLEPYSRIKVREHEAAAFLDIETKVTPEHKGAVALSRAPADWEPSYDMSLNELRIYLELLPDGGPNFPAGRLVIGESEEDIRAKFEDKKQAARALEEAKDLCWKRIQLRLFNPEIPYPTKNQFEKLAAKRLGKAEKKVQRQEVASSEVADLLAKHGA